MLTQRNLASVIAVAKEYGFDESFVYLSYLPLAHILERVMVTSIVNTGGRIGFYRG